MSLPRVATGQPLHKGVNASHWLGQHPPDDYASPARFDAGDAAWIAAQGYDHVRIPVDGRILLDEREQLRTELLKPFDDALGWAETHGLAVVFDMHYLEGTNFVTLHGVDADLYNSPALQQKAAHLWRQVARYFHGRAPHMAFEVLNEAIAPEHEQLNDLNRLLVGAVRDEEPTRVTLISSNRWGKLENAPYLDPPEDPNLAYAFHYYEPGVFTHQHAPWTDVSIKYPYDVSFPTRLDNLAEHFEAGSEHAGLHGVELNEAWVRQAFQDLADWAKANGDAPIVVNEFGTGRAVPMASGWRWLQVVRDACDAHGIGWTVWDYKGGFAIREPSGEPTYRHHALFAPTAESDLPEEAHSAYRTKS